MGTLQRNALTVGLALLGLIASSWMAHSDSLFPVKAASKDTLGSSSSIPSSLYSDSRAHSVGDILTVTIAESTSASATANLKTEQDDTVSAAQGSGLWTHLFGSLPFTVSQNRSANGSGATTRTGNLVTTLSVMVKEVLPNGTLRIEGSRIVGINKETQKVTFMGVVRPEDVATDNTIPSTSIAGVEIHYDGKGAASDTTRPSILSRIFRFLF